MSNDISNALLALAEMNDQVVAVIVGYRAKLESAGFSPAAAEAMCIQYHESFVAQVIGQVSK